MGAEGQRFARMGERAVAQGDRRGKRAGKRRDQQAGRQTVPAEPEPRQSEKPRVALPQAGLAARLFKGPAGPAKDRKGESRRRQKEGKIFNRRHEPQSDAGERKNEKRPIGQDEIAGVDERRDP
jgi:hypothetical protein